MDVVIVDKGQKEGKERGGKEEEEEEEVEVVASSLQGMSCGKGWGTLREREGG